eukprot:1419863-Prymnesium_polylepis.1
MRTTRPASSASSVSRGGAEPSCHAVPAAADGSEPIGAGDTNAASRPGGAPGAPPPLASTDASGDARAAEAERSQFGVVSDAPG